MVSPNDLVDKAMSQQGKAYDEAPTARLDEADPAGSFDCSLLVQWSTAQLGLAPPLPRTTWLQLQHCVEHGTVVPLDQAVHIRGALLFTHRDAAGHPVDPALGRAARGHVAISLGDGARTIEAMGTKYGVAVQSLTERSFSHAALVPGLVYAPEPPVRRVDPVVPAATNAPVDAGVGHPATSGPTSDPGTWFVTGTMGDGVEALQDLLRTAALRLLAGTDPLADFPTTGDFGSMTDIAVRLFQFHVQRHVDPSMEVDGKVGPATWKALQDLAG